MAKPSTIEHWGRGQVAVLAGICLVAGVVGGWSIRAWATARTQAAVPAQAQGAGSLKALVDAQMAPLLEKLQADPKNPDLLINVGNAYYDAQQYPLAIDYYRRALEARPGDAAVRTDMGTAYWFSGDADSAIAQFDQVLKDAPTNANTLFNRGLVRWKGKKDAAGSIADWQKLLASNPAYPERDKVEQMIAEVRQQTMSASAAR